MSQAILNAAPLAILQGIQDTSARPPVIDPEVIPTHLPHVYLYAEKGPTLPQLVSGDSFTQIYGAKTLDPRYPYFNHQSALANLLQGDGNALMVQRIVPDDAPNKARILLSLDIVSEDIQQYERNEDGSIKLDAEGAKIAVTGQGATLPGYLGKWVVNQWNTTPEVEAFGTCAKRQGSIVNASSDQSQLYPILELEVSWQGDYGKNLAMRFAAPTTASAVPLNGETANLVKSYLYRMQFLSRPTENSSPLVIKTLQGDQSVDFSFDESAIDLKLERELGISSILLQAFSDLDSPGTPPTYGPFGQLHVYKDNLNEVLAMIGGAEAPSGLLPEDTMDETSEYLNMVNPFTGTDLNGVPYYTLQLQGPESGGVLLNGNSTIYAAGGGDGTMDFASFDAAVKDRLSTYDSGEANLLDDALYPQSCLYDTGFTLDTKLAFAYPLGVRKDVYVVVSTQDVSQPANTGSEESSMASALKTAFRNYPDSEVYGTSVCRAIIIGHCGKMINSKYRGPQGNQLPLTLEFAHMSAKFMSSGTGVWRSGFGFDMSPNNQLKLFRDVNVGAKPATARTSDWAIGLNWVQNYDRRSLFLPAVQTVYDDDSSVLNSAINMMVCVELQKVAQRTWRDLTGISSLTADQFIERSNKLIDKRTTNRFDNRVTIKAETFYTQNDATRGYSWSCNIHMYAPNMKTVGTFTIVAHRQSDLAAAA